MTTQPNIDLPQALFQAARALRFALIVQGLVRWAAWSGGGALSLVVIDELLHLPQGLRLPLGGALIVYMAAEFYQKVLIFVWRPFSLAQAARWLEIHRGIGGNVLINAYQFESDSKREQVGYVRPVVDSSSSILRAIPPRSLWLTVSLKRWLLGLILVAAGWLLLGTFFPRYLVTGIERIFLPLADVAPVGSWTIEVQPRRHITVVEGDKLDVTVRVKSALGLNAKPPVPELVWQEAQSGAQESANEHTEMIATKKPNEFVFSFSSVSRPFSFWISADDSRSSSVGVAVVPLPQLKGSSFSVTPSAYTGLKTYEQPGPPEALQVPVGSTVMAKVELKPDSRTVIWKTEQASSKTDKTRAADPSENMTESSGKWMTSVTVDNSSTYELLVAMPGLRQTRVVTQGQITAVPDGAPEVDFLTDNRNLALNPGDTLAVTIKASDDYGVAGIKQRLAPSDDPSAVRVLKSWIYEGPPGMRKPVPETYTLVLDPAVFTPGSTFLLTAQAMDFSPTGHRGTSRPILVHVAGLNDLTMPSGDSLEKFFNLLKNTIVQQTQANGLTANLALHLSEAVSAADVPKHLGMMGDAQKKAQDLGDAALSETAAHDEGKIYTARLQSLVNGEMDLASGQVIDLNKTKSDILTEKLSKLQKRQAYILNGLIELLGQMVTDRDRATADLAKKEPDLTPSVSVADELSKLRDELKAFDEKQKKIVAATTAIKELNPEDLTTGPQAMLGELAREEAKAAVFFQNKLTDLSKLPLQDSADGKLVGDWNEVFQEVQKAADALYAKRLETAVTYEGVGLEKAAQIEQNLERWLSNSPDNTKWSMEATPKPEDMPMAELPEQLDDLIGDLMKQELADDPEKDDVSSAFLDSLDKGAGWGTGDGPISNMSARGVTGNQLPNNTEINGRSGEGRAGKSNGQMVGDTAVGKGGNETPTRMTPAPFENGSVNDQSKDTKGGATGGGKLAGAGQEGLHGPMPPAVQQRLQVLANQQAKLRQQAESLSLRLRKQRRPTGDLETAINAMKDFENAARRQDGLAVVQGYHAALDSLAAARTIYSGKQLRRVELDAMSKDTTGGVSDAQAEEAPAGYEEMTGAYFRSLSGEKSNDAKAAQADAK